VSILFSDFVRCFANTGHDCKKLRFNVERSVRVHFVHGGTTIPRTVRGLATDRCAELETVEETFPCLKG
jgi:hypothetical protein